MKDEEERELLWREFEQRILPRLEKRVEVYQETPMTAVEIADGVILVGSVTYYSGAALIAIATETGIAEPELVARLLGNALMQARQPKPVQIPSAPPGTPRRRVRIGEDS